MNKIIRSIMVLVVTQFLLFPYALGVCYAESNVPEAVKTQGRKVVKNRNSISVPGYAQINLVADEEEQTVPLRNPEQNDCYFKISIVLEDGTVIWESDLMEPGTRAQQIKLLQTLPEGVYRNVTIKYDCFSLNKKTPLNNARIKLKLVVRKKQGGKEML